MTSNIENEVKNIEKKELTPREKNKARMKLKRDQQKQEESSVEKQSRLEIRREIYEAQSLLEINASRREIYEAQSLLEINASQREMYEAQPLLEINASRRGM